MATNSDDFKKIALDYWKDLKLEFSKITWPDKKQVIVQTCIVIVIVTIFTVYTYLLDISFIEILKLLRLR